MEAVTTAVTAVPTTAFLTSGSSSTGSSSSASSGGGSVGNEQVPEVVTPPDVVSPVGGMTGSSGGGGMGMVPVSVSGSVMSPSSMMGGGGGGGGDDIPNDPGKMFIGGLSWQTSPESIREYFSAFGELAEVMVMKDPATRRSRGFGFITFSDPRSVDEVLKYPVHQLDGKLVEPKVAVPRKTNPKLVMRTREIFVGGLSSTTSLEDVKAYFEQFSKVKEAMLAYDKITNRHRGFGFVTFDNEDVVDKICEIHFHEINGKMVESKKALPKEPRLAYYNSFYGNPMAGYGMGRGGNMFGNPYGMRGGGNPYGHGYGSPMGHAYDQYAYHGGSHARGGGGGPDGETGGGGGPRGHLLQMGHFDNSNYGGNGGGGGSNYDNEMRYFGNAKSGGNAFGTGGGSADRQNEYGANRFGGSSPGHNRSAFNNYRMEQQGNNTSRMYDRGQQQQNGGMDSGNGLGMLSNGYYRSGGGGGGSDYTNGGGRDFSSNSRFGGPNNNYGSVQQQVPDHSFNDDDFPELTTSKFNNLRLSDEAHQHSVHGSTSPVQSGGGPSDPMGGPRSAFGQAQGPSAATLAGF